MFVVKFQSPYSLLPCNDIQCATHLLVLIFANVLQILMSVQLVLTAVPTSARTHTAPTLAAAGLDSCSIKMDSLAMV